MNPIRLASGVVALLVALVILFALWPFVSVSAGHRGVVVIFGEVNPQPLTEGFHVVNPLARVVDVDVRLQKFEAEGEGASKDLQSVHTTLAVNYTLSPEATATLYREIGLDYGIKVIDPIVQDRFKSVTAQYTAEQLITHREEVRQKVRALVTELAKQRAPAIQIQDVLLTNFAFAKSFNEAIEQKVTAEQLALKAERDLERIKTEAEQRVAQAKGEAEAIRIQAQAITQQGGEAYVKLKWVEKWSGELPQTMLGEGAVPLITVNK